ncbi:hypothetical protein Dimus_035408, partial [Dionaea muscipula]
SCYTFSQLLSNSRVTRPVPAPLPLLPVNSSHQRQLEIFIGIRLFRHLPSIPVYPLQHKCKSIVAVFRDVSLLSFILLELGADAVVYVRYCLALLLAFLCQFPTYFQLRVKVCPQAADVVEVFIYLSEPSHVCQLLLTVAHGSDDLTFPSTVDVRCGRDLDGLKLVLEGAFIPQCANGTNIVIPLLGLVSSEDMAVTGAGVHLGSSEASHLALLYDFKELEAELEFLTRAVALTFYPPISGRTPITLGE